MINLRQHIIQHADRRAPRTAPHLCTAAAGTGRRDAVTNTTHPGPYTVTLTREQADRRHPSLTLSLYTARKARSNYGRWLHCLVNSGFDCKFGQLRDQALSGVRIDRATFAAVTASCVTLSLAGMMEGQKQAVGGIYADRSKPADADSRRERSDSC